MVYYSEISMKIELKNKKTKPPFQFFVKENIWNPDYYVYNSFEDAMNKARVLSQTKFPLVNVMEVSEDKYGEWKLNYIFMYMKGECKERNERGLHVKFYTDAGECLNYKDDKI